ASKCFAGIGQRMLDEVFFFAPQRYSDFDFVADLGAQRFRQQLAIGDRMGNQNKSRRRPIIVKLREESRKDFPGSERTVGLWKIGAIAPALPGAKEENLHAGEPALLMHGKNVGLLDAAWIDTLMRLDRRQCGKAISIDRRALEIERGRGFFHFLGKLAFDPLAASGKKFVGLAHQRR